MSHMIGRVMAFNNEDGYFQDEAALVELTEVRKDGSVEIAFDLPNKVRVYVAVKLQDLAAAAIAFGKE